jgi:hypothetical protein
VETGKQQWIRDVPASEPIALFRAVANSGRESSAYLPLPTLALGAAAGVLLAAGLATAGLAPMVFATLGWAVALGLAAAACVVAGFLFVEGILIAPQNGRCRFALPLEHSLNQSGVQTPQKHQPCQSADCDKHFVKDFAARRFFDVGESRFVIFT